MHFKFGNVGIMAHSINELEALLDEISGINSILRGYPRWQLILKRWEENANKLILQSDSK